VKALIAMGAIRALIICRPFVWRNPPSRAVPEWHRVDGQSAGRSSVWASRDASRRGSKRRRRPSLSRGTGWAIPAATSSMCWLRCRPGYVSPRMAIVCRPSGAPQSQHVPTGAGGSRPRKSATSAAPTSANRDGDQPVRQARSAAVSGRHLAKPACRVLGVKCCWAINRSAVAQRAGLLLLPSNLVAPHVTNGPGCLVSGLGVHSDSRVGDTCAGLRGRRGGRDRTAAGTTTRGPGPPSDGDDDEPRNVGSPETTGRGWSRNGWSRCGIGR
jgi:hypothetical protein